MNERYPEDLRHLIRAAFIDGLRHFTSMDEKSIDGTYRSCIDEVRAAIELLDCTIDGDNGEETEQLDVELVKHILSIILESLGTDTAWSQRIRILIVELNMLLEMWKLVGVQAATFH